jgi:hypothetical protein
MNATDTTESAPHFAVAGVVLDALAAQDFTRLGAALDADAEMSALVPKGLRECHGPAEICAMFETWFGDFDEYAVTDASVGAVGALLQMRWRLRVKGPRFGDEQMIVEQHAYAATGPSGRISRISLLCSGFWPEHGEMITSSNEHKEHSR